jgi:ketosteroid isomerase-like protein
LILAACGAPAANTNANSNSNANAAKTTAAAPTADALFAMDKQANEAWIKGDKAFFDGFLSDKFVSFENGKRMSKADIGKMISETKCDIKTWSLEDPQMSKIDNDTYVITYKGNFDGTCSGADGKSMKVPSPVRGGSVYVRDGDKWKGVFHGENMIIDPKAPPVAPAASDKKEEPKTDAKKEEPKKDDKMAANSNTAAETKPAAPTADPNTDALTKLHNAGWEAFKNKDAKKFEEMTTKDLSNIDPLGMWISGQANVIKHWTADMKCEGITKAAFTDGFASALSPTVEVLTGKGYADGTCDGMKNGDLYQTAFYVKDGDAWKLAFMFESAPMPGM